MTDLQTRAEPAASAAPEPADAVRGRAGARRRPQAQLALAGALTAFLAFQAGGFFPAAVGVSAAALAVLLALRVTLAAQPFAGWSASAAVVAAAGAGLAAWVVASAAWSSAPGRALVELDRVLLYLLAFAVCAVFPRRPGALATLLRWVLLAIVAVAVAGLATRLVPDAFTAAPGREPARLAFPLTYWNAMGVICAIGLVLALQAASGAREPAWGRVLAGAALPVLVVAGYLPLSRGGIATAALGAVLYLALARPPRLLTTLVTAGPPAGIALAVAYHADALTRASYAQPPGPHEGHRVALVLAACAAAAALLRLAALRLDGRVDRLAAAIRAGGRGRRAALALGVVVAVVAVGFAGGAPAWVHSQYRAFERGNVVDPGSDTRLRLTDAGNNGRLALWRVARRSFAGEPLHGTGAGTYEFAWARERPTDMDAVDAHSLYLETLAELGVVGLILLATMLGGMLVAVGRGLRGGERHASAAVLAAGCALLAHAAIDWDWEMPALFVWLFCAAGVACAAPAAAAGAAARPAGGGLGRLPRLLAGLACLLVAVTPALVARSDAQVHRAGAAFVRGDCREAIDAALDGVGALSTRPEPYEILGYCDLRAGAYGLGVRAMRAARAREPESWRYAYGLAIARALAGRDPRPQIALARRLNPLAPEARSLARALAGDRRSAWRRAAARARLPGA